jgi:actin-like ATPase involved in cell morphogenesis
MQAGAREVYLIDGPMARQSEQDLTIQETSGGMIVDMGGGSS